MSVLCSSNPVPTSHRLMWKLTAPPTDKNSLLWSGGLITHCILLGHIVGESSGQVEPRSSPTERNFCCPLKDLPKAVNNAFLELEKVSYKPSQDRRKPELPG